MSVCVYAILETGARRRCSQFLASPYSEAPFKCRFLVLRRCLTFKPGSVAKEPSSLIASLTKGRLNETSFACDDRKKIRGVWKREINGCRFSCAIAENVSYGAKRPRSVHPPIHRTTALASCVKRKKKKKWSFQVFAFVCASVFDSPEWSSKRISPFVMIAVTRPLVCARKLPTPTI